MPTTRVDHGRFEPVGEAEAAVALFCKDAHASSRMDILHDRLAFRLGFALNRIVGRRGPAHWQWVPSRGFI